MYIILLFFFFIGLGANLASLSPYVLSHFGEKGEWIFLAIQLSMPVGTFFAGWISDRTKMIRSFVLVGVLLLAPTQYLLFSFHDNWLLTALLGGFQRFLLSANFQWISIGAMEEKGDHKFTKIRSAGTLGFLFVQLVLYLLSSSSLESFKTPSETGISGAFAYLICFFPALFLPKNRASSTEFRLREAWQLVQKKQIRYFFILAFFYYSAYQVTDNYLGKFFQMKMGLESVFLVWLVAVILEIPFLLLVSRISLRFGISTLFYLALIFGILRFGFLCWGVFGLPNNILVIMQFYHSILFAGFYMGAILWLRKKSPSHIYGSIYGLYSIFAQSMGGIFGNLLCGQILHSRPSLILVKYFPDYEQNLLDYFPIFFYALIVLIILFYCFWKLKSFFYIHSK